MSKRDAAIEEIKARDALRELKAVGKDKPSDAQRVRDAKAAYDKAK
jgi:hypothetical protein